MIGSIKAIAKVIFSILNYKFNAGDVSFSLWNIIMTFLICGLVGMLLYYFVVGVSSKDD